VICFAYTAGGAAGFSPLPVAALALSALPAPTLTAEAEGATEGGGEEDED